MVWALFRSQRRNLRYTHVPPGQGTFNLTVKKIAPILHFTRPRVWRLQETSPKTMAIQKERMTRSRLSNHRQRKKTTASVPKVDQYAFLSGVNTFSPNQPRK
uniref:Uncharacterized protein n=1 Tax=Cacopsylla melanoneura TaxID=428564 RepID=A0A8D8Q3Q1_9HEMI